jgi:hypothetical protein
MNPAYENSFEVDVLLSEFFLRTSVKQGKQNEEGGGQ